MARGFGMTALRAALGGVAGYGQDVATRREREKVEAEMARQQERQAALDRLAMRREGYMTPEEAGAERMAGGTALSRALASASGMLAGRPGPAFGQALGAGDGTAIVRGMGQLGPQQRETLGGQTFVREAPEAARMRAEELAFNRERMGEERKSAQRQAEKQAEVAASEQRLGAAFPGINRARLAAVAAGDVDLKDVLPPKPERAPRTGPTEDELDQAEGIFNTPGLDPKLARSMTATFNRLRAAYPTAPPRQLIYQAVQGAMRGMKATQEMQPRGQGGDMGLGTGDAQLDADIAALRGQAAAPAARPATPPAAPGSLESEFPSPRHQHIILEGRKDGYTDAEIRDFILKGG
jgi:hypothetical protein